MRFSSFVVRAAIAAVTAAVMIPLTSLSQTFAANTGPDVLITTAPPPSPDRVSVPGHHRGDEAQMFGRVRDGVYTVDGMVAKLRLNYDIQGTPFLYLFVPGVGTAVVSAGSAPEAVVGEARLQDNELTFRAGDHAFKLTGIALLNGHGSAPEHLYVRLDRAAWALSRHPMVGFGNTLEAPYQWPGALPVAAAAPTAAEAPVLAPPVPVALLPSPTAVHARNLPAEAQPVALSPVALR